MKKVIVLDVPDSFYKKVPFYCEPEEIRSFYRCFCGYIENGVVEWLRGEVDIDLTIESHTGDCRIWFRSGGYDVLSASKIFMEVGVAQYYEDIFEYMKENIPTLYQKHMEYAD